MYLELEEELSNFVTRGEVEKLNKLKQNQVELLILYLKNKNSNKVVSRDFSLIIDELKIKSAKSSSQKRITKLFFIGVALCVLSGGVLSGLILSSSFDNEYLKIILFLLFMGTLGLAINKFLIPLIDAVEKQERNYFLKLIRSAKNCDELDQAGFFKCHGASEGLDWEAEFAEKKKIVRNLRSSLYADNELGYIEHDEIELKQP